MTPMELVIVQINNLVKAKERGQMTATEWNQQLLSTIAEYKVAVIDQVK